MSDESKKKGLGRGLAALLGGEGEEDLANLDRIRSSKEVPVEDLIPSPFQPRRNWDEEELNSLVGSIREKGVLQPILVRRSRQEPDKYEIIAGERRWRAAQKAQLYEVPVIIRDFDDRDTLEIALIENIQRQDLTPIEEAAGYQRLMEEFSYTQDQLSQALGKSRSHIANTLRLLTLPEKVRAYVDSGALSAGAARALITAENPVELAEKAIRQGLNVRQIERLRKRQGKDGEQPARAVKNADTIALENSLSAAVGMKVVITCKDDGSGTVNIRYASLEQLDDLCQRLSRPLEGHHDSHAAGVGHADSTASLPEDPLEEGDNGEEDLLLDEAMEMPSDAETAMMEEETTGQAERQGEDEIFSGETGTSASHDDGDFAGNEEVSAEDSAATEDTPADMEDQRNGLDAIARFLSGQEETAEESEKPADSALSSEDIDSLLSEVDEILERSAGEADEAEDATPPAENKKAG